jgi:Ca2+-transporting ATPase
VKEIVNARTGAAAIRRLGGGNSLAKELDVDATLGLPSSRVEAMRKTYGSNTIPEKTPKSFLEHLMESFEDETVLILVAAAFLAVGNAVFISDDDSDMIEAVSIIAAVAIVCGAGSILNFIQDREFRALKQLKRETVFVQRDGVQTRIQRGDLVVGDCIDIRAGSTIPADAVVLPVSAQGLSLDESSVTGESEPRLKSAAGDSLLLAGTRATEGAGRAMVVAVGEKSSYGQQLVQSQGGEDDDGPTPLQQRLDKLAKTIGWFGLAAAVMTSGALAVIALLADPSKAYSVEFWMGDMVQFGVVGITIVVVAVPEGLPLAVTISLAFSASAMVADKILVRKIQACETMGSATVICSDKTGTLTQNRMTVVAGRLATLPFTLHSEPATSLGSPRALIPASELRGKLSEELRLACGLSVIMNSDAARGRDTVPTDMAEPAAADGAAPPSKTASAKLVWLGNPSECAMLEFLEEQLSQRTHQLRAAVSSAGVVSADAGRSVATGIVHRRNFSSLTKSMATAVELPPAMGGGSWLYVKGSFKQVLAQCTTELHTDGKPHPIDAEAIAAQFEPATDASLRTLAVARKRVDGSASRTIDWGAEEASGGFELVGVLGIRDPLRPEVPAAVAACQDAGIRVVMVTGDQARTATAIARGCGILPPAGSAGVEAEGAVLLGEELEALSDDPVRLRKAAEAVRVVALSKPEHKHLLVDALRKADHVVAATGDGTNDGPALKHANVGLAMGITGTDVAKDASDMVILDDNFGSIRKAVVWGRSVQENVRRFLTYQLTINIVALALSFFAACSLGSSPTGSADAGDIQERLARQLPLNSQQMLFCNLLMDSLAALALATEPPSDDLLRRAPERKGSALITLRMWKHVIGQALFQLAVLVTLYLHPTFYQWFGVETFRSVEHRTVIFNVFILLNLVALPFARKVRDELDVLSGIHKCTLFLIILAGAGAVQVGLVQFGGEFFGTVPLSIEQWQLCGALSLTTVPVEMLLRLLPLPTGDEPVTGAGKRKTD